MPSVQTRARQPLKSGYILSPDDLRDAFDPAQLRDQARLAEEGQFDFIRFSERGLGGAHTAARTEPFTTASYLATLTRKIGLLVDGNTSYYEPFNLARLIASLDHVTHGRAGWNIVTGASRAAQANFSQGEQTAESHYARAAEVVDILRQLWDSWEEGAFIRNKATGEYVDGARIHPIHHKGNLFRIKGPLNVARSPQGHAVAAHTVTDGDALAAELAVREADVIFLAPASPAVLRQQTDRLRGDLRRQGREARLFVELVPAAIDGVTAEAIEALTETAQADGFTLRLPRQADALGLYVREVVPSLQARGLLAEAYAGTTLRDHLGLSEPANRYAA